MVDSSVSPFASGRLRRRTFDKFDKFDKFGKFDKFDKEKSA
ncbi:hypothetical protein ACFQYP_32700 [Nonomuraea antimicrobica]